MTTEVPRATAPAADSSRPGVGVALISLGDPDELAGLLAGLVSACREYGVDLIVVRRGPPAPIPGLDQTGVRVVHGRLDEGLAALRARGFAELGSDIILIATDAQLACDWSALLLRLGQLAHGGEEEIERAEWMPRLRAAGVPDPAS